MANLQSPESREAQMTHRDRELRRELDALLDADPAEVIARGRARFDELAAPFPERLVLFGAGALGQRTLAGLRNAGIEPLAFADNSAALWGQSVEGIRVVPPAEAAEQFGASAAFVVTVFRLGPPTEQLRALGCATVVPYAPLFWKYPEAFLPFCFMDLPTEIFAQREAVRRAFDLWSDDASRREYVAQIRWRTLLDFDPLPPASDDEYFPPDLVQMREDENFVDCGTFDGDTIRAFLERSGGRFGRIAGVEPDPANFARTQRYVATLPAGLRERIDLLPYAAGERRQEVRFAASGDVTSTVVSEGGCSEGAIEVECAPLDELLPFQPTFIKMDVEGAERDAVAGAARLLREARPTLALCAYHRADDMWQLPLLIDRFAPGYRFHLRRHAEGGWDLVCYAVPAERALR
jgi:FkbM family methyltransferase